MESNPQSIHCGSADDNLETLKKVCEVEATKLCLTLNVKSGEILEIPFWTSDFPELICVGKFSMSDNGSVNFDLDFSESTL